MHLERASLEEFARVVTTVGLVVMALGLFMSAVGMLVHIGSPPADKLVTLSSLGKGLAMYGGEWLGVGALVVATGQVLYLAHERLSITRARVLVRIAAADGGEDL